jgi:hypothetical protein
LSYFSAVRVATPGFCNVLVIVQALTPTPLLTVLVNTDVIITHGEKLASFANNGGIMSNFYRRTYLSFRSCCGSLFESLAILKIAQFFDWFAGDYRCNNRLSNWVLGCDVKNLLKVHSAALLNCEAMGSAAVNWTIRQSPIAKGAKFTLRYGKRPLKFGNLFELLVTSGEFADWYRSALRAPGGLHPCGAGQANTGFLARDCGSRHGTSWRAATLA